MSSVCPQCGGEIRPGAKFCRACGTALPPGPEPATAPATPPVQPPAPLPAHDAALPVAPPLPPPAGPEAVPDTGSALIAANAEESGTVTPSQHTATGAPPAGETAPAQARGAQRPPALPPRAATATRDAAPRAVSAPKRRRPPKALALGAVVVLLVLGAGTAFYVLGGVGWVTRPETIPAEAKEAVRRGVSLASERQYDRAIVEFSQAIAVAPRYGVAYANRGVAYIQKREFVKALDDLRRAAQLSPRDPIVHYNLAALYSLQNERTFALEALQKALEQGFNDFEALRRDPDFDRIRQEARFRELVERYRRR